LSLLNQHLEKSLFFLFQVLTWWSPTFLRRNQTCQHRYVSSEWQSWLRFVHSSLSGIHTGVGCQSCTEGSNCHYGASEKKYLTMKQKDLVKSCIRRLAVACLKVCSRQHQCSSKCPPIICMRS
jgi:hypothetical protein